MQTTTTQHAERQQAPRDPNEETDYARLRVRLRDTLESHTGTTLLTTDATGLFDLFLGGLPPEHRQHYNCHTCRGFFDRYGGNVVVDPSGVTYSPFWDDPLVPAGSFFARAIGAVRDAVRRAKATGVFLSSASTWGAPYNASPKSPYAYGDWHHLHAVPHASMIYKATRLKNAEQAMAERREEYGMLQRGLAEFSIETVRQAHAMLASGQLFRSEKCVLIAQWLLSLHEERAATKNSRVRENLAWRAVASAPPGYCHVRTTMIGTLLEDVAAGKDFADIKLSFDARMAPLFYRRPQAAPTDGQIAAAEKAIAALGASGALARRYATLDDVKAHAIWMPKEAKVDAPSGGVFGHLRTKLKEVAPLAMPPTTITWEKFARVVLPDAERIEFLVPHASRSGFFGFLTAEDPAAPPILQWDREDARNPVSWYFYNNGSCGRAWGLQEGAWHDVVALTKQPSTWTSDSAHHGDGLFFVLRGSWDLQMERNDSLGLALIPETLRSEYHSIRAAIDAYSSSMKLSGDPAQQAAGIAFRKGSPPWSNEFRVTAMGTTLLFRLDRWD